MAYTAYDETFKMTALAASTSQNVPIPPEDVKKYGPFNIVYVVNNSSEVIDIVFDGDSTRKKTIAAESTLSINEQNFYTLVETNTDAANATDNDEVVIIVQKVV